MNCAIGSGAFGFDTLVPVERYELTIVTPDESAAASRRSKFVEGSSGFTISARTFTDRRSSALNVAPAAKSVRLAIEIDNTRVELLERASGTSESESLASVIDRSAARAAKAKCALSPTIARTLSRLTTRC